MSKEYKKLTKVEIKNLCPIISMINSGKTSFLKFLYDIDFLEVSTGMRNKFVNIIRYNPNVGEEPKFYHLILKKGKKTKYEYFKDPNFKEVIGPNNIKRVIKRLNNSYKSGQNASYEDLFYMVEIGHTNIIKDEEYLKNYDLVDIPSVSEYKYDENYKEKPTSARRSKINYKNIIYDSIEKIEITYESEYEKTYLTEIIKIMKDNINSGIIIFSVDNFILDENYEIIGILQKVLNKPIENYLILLNKIDKRNKIENDIKILEGKIMKYFPSSNLFNFKKNLIVPVSIYQLENELKLQNSFHHFLNYHYLNFLMHSKKGKSGISNKKTKLISFIDYLKKINPIKKITKKYYRDLLNQILEDKNLETNLSEIKFAIEFITKYNNSSNNLNLGVRPDDFEKSKIEELKEIINDDEDEKEDDEEDEDNDFFNINEQDDKGIIIYYYSLFKNKNKKIIPKKSKEYVKITNYFMMRKFEQKEYSYIKSNNKDIKLEKSEDYSEKENYFNSEDIENKEDSDNEYNNKDINSEKSEDYLKKDNYFNFKDFEKKEEYNIKIDNKNINSTKSEDYSEKENYFNSEDIKKKKYSNIRKYNKDINSEISEDYSYKNNYFNLKGIKNEEEYNIKNYTKDINTEKSEDYSNKNNYFNLEDIEKKEEYDIKNDYNDIDSEKSEDYLQEDNIAISENFEKNVENNIIKEKEIFNNFINETKIKKFDINDSFEEKSNFYKEKPNEYTNKVNHNFFNPYLNNSPNIPKTSQYLYIPFLGPSSSGKSTILNTLIGFKLLPTHKNICTKKGILIKYWDKPDPAIRRTYLRDCNNYFEPDEKEIAFGVENIQRILEAGNYEFSKNREDFFFEIDVNIRFINELNFDNDLKEKICFIDLPGYGTNNEFEEQNIYTDLIDFCYLFVFVVFNLTIKENKNQNLLNRIFQKKAKSRGITSNTFLEKCLFIVNADEKQEISEKTLNQAKADIIYIINNKKNKNYFNDINICFYNAKFYEQYLSKLIYYKSGVNIIQTEYKAYKNLKAKSLKGLIDDISYGSFYKYLSKKLQDNIKNDIEIRFVEKEVTQNEDMEKSINNILENNSLKLKSKEITLISKYIIFGSENIIKSNLKFESKYEDFKNILYRFIKGTKAKENNENLIKSKKRYKKYKEVDNNYFDFFDS